MVGTINTLKNEISYTFLYNYHQEYSEERNGNVLIFEIWEKGKQELPKFSFSLLIMTNGTDLKVVDLFADNKYYLGKGISIAMISHCKFLFRKRIISERGKDNWPDARSKVWERMKSSGEVSYCESKDFYFTL